MTARRYAALMRNLAATFLGCAVAFVLCEALVRTLDLPPKPLPPLNVNTYRLSENPILRFEYRPGYANSLPQFHDSMRGFSINDDGFRDIHHDLQKPPGTTRIIVLGDSITAGNGVLDVAHTYPRRLAAELDQRSPETKHEVFNMGVGGYNTLQEVETLRTKGLRYNPDIVVIGFCVNDFSWTASVYDRLREQMDAGQSEVWSRNSASLSGPLRTVINRSRFAFFTYHQILDLVTSRASTQGGGGVESLNPVEAGYELLEQLRTQHGIQAWIFIIPALDNLMSEYAHFDIHERVMAIARKYPDIHTVDLVHAVRDTVENPSGLSIDGLHPNEAGHALLARLIAETLAAGESPITGVTAEQARILIVNSSFEVVADGRPVSWHCSHPQLLAASPASAEASDGERYAVIENDAASWVVVAQHLRLEAQDAGRRLHLAAMAKVPRGGVLYLDCDWQSGGERENRHIPWDQPGDDWQGLTLDVDLPRDADLTTVRARLILKPGEPFTCSVDAFQAHIE